jgi:tetratricopeptide (TPR) repeat protein
MENIQIIECYLDGQLSEEEKSSFEQELKNDPKLQLELKKHKFIRQAGEHIYAQDLKKHFEKVRIKSLSDQAPVIPIYKRRKWLGLAASIILILTFGILFTYNSSYPSRLIASSYTQPSLDRTRGSESNNVNMLLEQAMQYHAKQEYQQAIELFNKITDDMPQFVESMEMLSDAYVQTKDYSLARDILVKITRRTSRGLSIEERMKWNLALIHLKLKETKEAKDILEELAKDPSSTYYIKAQKVLKKI